MKDIDFPYQLVEVINGSLSVALAWMMGFLILHFIHVWRVLKSHWGPWASIPKIYLTNKPEIALFVIVLFFFIRIFSLWYLRFIKNNHFDGLFLIISHDAFILVGTTAVIILGICCWIRVISPLSGSAAWLVWLLMLISSLGFGIGMAYVF